MNAINPKNSNIVQYPPAVEEVVKTSKSILKKIVIVPPLAALVMALPIAISIDFVCVLKKPDHYEENLVPGTECILGIALDIIDWSAKNQ